MNVTNLILDFVRVTEDAAIACSALTGAGDRKEADRLATEAMRSAFNTIPFSGTIVIGEGERDEAPMLFIGEKVGKGGIEVDIAVDPLEGTNLCAEDRAGAITVMAIGPKGSLKHAPDTYMNKIVVGPQVTEKISLAYTLEENLDIIARAYDCDIEDLNIIVMKRSRHDQLVKDIRALGAKIRFIDDGDVFGGLSALMAEETGVHALIGIGAAPEGVITACAVKALGGQMEGQFMPYDGDMKEIQQDVVERMHQMGIADIQKRYTADELACGDNVIFIATGVTSGEILQGIESDGEYLMTDSIVISSEDKTIRTIQTKHLM